jgi:hypothetical protein
MKNICKIGWIGLVFALVNCQSVNSSKMFYEGVKPEMVSDKFSFTEGPSADKEGMCILRISLMIRFIIGTGKPIRLSNF